MHFPSEKKTFRIWWNLQYCNYSNVVTNLVYTSYRKEIRNARDDNFLLVIKFIYRTNGSVGDWLQL